MLMIINYQIGPFIWSNLTKQFIKHSPLFITASSYAVTIKYGLLFPIFIHLTIIYDISIYDTSILCPIYFLFSNHLLCPGVISMHYGLLAILFSPFPPLRSLLHLSQMLHRPQGNQGEQKLSINGTYKSLSLKLDFFFLNVSRI